MKEKLKMKMKDEWRLLEADPGIQIQFADEVSIHNCMSLASLATVGPANGVPTLTVGKKKVLNLLVGGLCFTHVIVVIQAQLHCLMCMHELGFNGEVSLSGV